MIQTENTIRVLFIDDNPDLLSASSDYLTLVCQMDVTPVQDVQTVFESEWLDYDCIILDYDMPDINGIEVLKKIRTIAPSIGVIVFTGKGHEEVVIEALNNGADYYLRKGENIHVFPKLAHYIVQSSRRYRAEKESLANQALYHLVIELQSEFVCTLRRDGTILFVNDAYCSYLNRSANDLAEANFFSVVKDNGTVQEAVQRLLCKSESERSTCPFDISSAIQKESIVVSTGFDGVKRSENWTFCCISDAQYQVIPKSRTHFSYSSGDILAIGHDITEAQERNTQHIGMCELGNALSEISSCDHAINLCANSILTLFPIDAITFYIKNEEMNSFDFAQSKGTEYHFLEQFVDRWYKSEDAQKILSGKIRYFSELQQKSTLNFFSQVILLPIHHHLEIKGWIAIGIHADALLPSYSLEVLQGIALQLGNALMRIHAEEEVRDALSESEGRYMQLSDASPDAIVIITDAEVSDLNPRALTLFGASSLHDFLRRPFMSYVHPSSVEEIQKLMNPKTPENRSSLSTEVIFLDREENKINAQLTVIPTFHDGKLSVLFIIRDITTEKTQICALLRSERRFREMMDLLPEPAFEEDATGNVIFLNKSGIQFLLGENKLPHRFSIRDFIVDRDSNEALLDIQDNSPITPASSASEKRAFDAMVTQVLIDGKTRFGEFLMMRAEPTMRPPIAEHRKPTNSGRDETADGLAEVIISIAGVQEDEQWVGIRGVIHDITTMKAYQQQLAESLEEKTVLFREVHHRVKNNMQIISSLMQLQSEYVTDETVLTSFQECENRISSMALVHETLYRSESLADILFQQYLETLAEEVVLSYSTTADIDIEINAGAYRLSLNAAVPIGLILNELMMNSFKHAFAGRAHGLISISLTEEKSSNPALRRFRLRYEDDGCGFPAELMLKSSETLGMRLIRMLSKQLSDSVAHFPDRPPEKRGVAFELIFSDSCVELHDSFNLNI